MAKFDKNIDLMDYENWDDMDFGGKQKTNQTKMGNMKAAARKADERAKDRERRMEREAADADGVVAQQAAKKERSEATKLANRQAAAAQRANAHGGSDEIPATPVTKVAAKRSYSDKKEYSKKPVDKKNYGKKY